jgi:hypothetical protein
MGLVPLALLGFNGGRVPPSGRLLEIETEVNFEPLKLNSIPSSPFGGMKIGKESETSL